MCHRGALVSVARSRLAATSKIVIEQCLGPLDIHAKKLVPVPPALVAVTKERRRVEQDVSPAQAVLERRHVHHVAHDNLDIQAAEVLSGFALAAGKCLDPMAAFQERPHQVVPEKPGRTRNKSDRERSHGVHSSKEVSGGDIPSRRFETLPIRPAPRPGKAPIGRSPQTSPLGGGIIKLDGNHLIVYGDESAGRYVQLLDVRTGRIVGRRGGAGQRLLR
jgi:hypothetical protein